MILAAIILAPADIVVGPVNGDATPAIQKALDEAAKQGVAVALKEGRYELRSGLKANAGLRAAAGAVVTLTGGRRLSGWTTLSDTNLGARLPEAARSAVRVAPLPVDAAEVTPRGMQLPVKPVENELFIDGEPMTVARWPNTDWAETGVITNGDPASTAPASFAFDKAQLQKWSAAKDAWVHGYWFHDWAEELLSVSKIDAEAGTIALGKRHGYGFKEKKRFFIQNLPEELDQPGEYWIDRAGKRIVFWPRQASDLDRAELSSLAEPLVTFSGPNPLYMLNLRLRHGRDSAVKVEGTTNTIIKQCDIEGFGTRGVDIVGGTKANITGCYIGQTGAEGISMSGGDRATLTPGEHLATQCEVTRFGRLWRTYRPGISMSGVANRISQCHIHEGGHSAILFFDSNYSIIEATRIERVCLETDDAGAIYEGRDWTCQGNVIRMNWISDVTGRTNLGAQAIYLDDAASGTYVFANIIERVQRAFLIGGGRDNTVMSNLVRDCPIGVHIDARGMGWMKAAVEPDGVLQQRWRAMPVTSEAWRSRFPALASYPDDQPGMPKNNRVLFNAFINSPGWDVAKEAQDTGDIDENARLGSLGELGLPADADLPAILKATTEARNEPQIDLSLIGCKVERISPRGPGASP